MGRFTGILGLLSMVGLAFAFSTDRRAIKLKTVLWGVGLQLTFAFLVLKFEVGRAIFAWLGAKVTQLLNFSYVGSEFIFGELGKKNSSFGAVFAFQILPTIIFIAALFALLYYLGVMQIVIRAAEEAGFSMLRPEDVGQRLPEGVEPDEYCLCSEPWDRVFHALFANTD